MVTVIERHVISARRAATSRSMSALGTGHPAVNRIAHLNLSECCRTLDDLDLQRRLGC
jgi:hypothetical protein